MFWLLLSSAYTKDFLASHTALPVRGLGLHKEGTIPIRLIQTGRRDIPYHMMPHWIIKLGQREKTAGVGIGQQVQVITPCITYSVYSFIIIILIIFSLIFLS